MSNKADGYREPTVDELFSDPIVQALMAADAVDEVQLRLLLGRLRDQLRQRKPQNSTYLSI